jgi:hypothetical protein
MTMPKPEGQWHMIACETCGLLVGWSRQKLTKPFYCIPHFDHVAHVPDETMKGKDNGSKEESGPE